MLLNVLHEVHKHIDFYPNPTRTFQFIQFLVAFHCHFICQLRHNFINNWATKMFNTMLYSQLISFSSILQKQNIFENVKIISVSNCTLKKSPYKYICIAEGRAADKSFSPFSKQYLYHFYRNSMNETYAVEFFSLLKKQSFFSLIYATIILKV